MIHKKLAVFMALAGFASMAIAQPFTWKEDFGADETCGILSADGFTTSNGTWTVEMSGPNGVEHHEWYVSAREAGLDDGECGDGCISDPDLEKRTLYISGETFNDIDGAAFEHTANSETDLRVVSPVIDMSDVDFELSLKFSYILGSHPSSSCFVQYYDGNAWSDLAEIEETIGDCGPAGEWTTTAFTFPPSAQNNPDVRIAFRWVNEGTDYMLFPELSFAVSEIECFCGAISAPVEDLEFWETSNIEYTEFQCSTCFEETYTAWDWALLVDEFGNSTGNTISLECCAGLDDDCQTGPEPVYYQVPGCGTGIYFWGEVGVIELVGPWYTYYDGGFELSTDTLCGSGCVEFTYWPGVNFESANSGPNTNINSNAGVIEIFNEGIGGDVTGEICFSGPGSYTISGSSEFCGLGNNYSAEITVLDCSELPTAAFSVSDTLICAGDCIDFTDESTGADIDSWTWQFEGADFSSSVEQHPTNICYDSIGTYAVTLEVTNMAGTDDSTIVDFIEVQNCPTPLSDLIISNAKYGSYDAATDSTWKNLEYSEYHYCQVRPLDLSATAKNIGTVDQTNVYLAVNINDGEGFDETITSASTSIAVGDSAQLAIDGYLPPSEPGEYELTYTLHQDQTDSIPENNSTTRNFKIHTSEFNVYDSFYEVYPMARDDGYPIASSNSGTGDIYMAGTAFHLTAPAEICCLGAAIMGDFVNGNGFTFSLYDKNFDYIHETELGFVSNEMEYDTTDMNFTWLPMDYYPVPITSETDVIAAFVNYFYEDTLQSIKIGVSNFDAPESSSFVMAEWLGSDSIIWEESDATYMIRIGLSSDFCSTAIAEIANHINNLSCAPNPSAGEVSVQFDLIEQSDVQLFLFDYMGRVMHKEELGSLSTGSYRFQYNWSNLAAGMYTVTIASNGKAMTKKLLIE